MPRKKQPANTTPTTQAPDDAATAVAASSAIATAELSPEVAEAAEAQAVQPAAPPAPPIPAMPTTARPQHSAAATEDGNKMEGRTWAVHGDIHGRNILMLDRLPAFIDFAWSGPGHPLVDLVRLDAVVRSAAMRMVLDERSMHDIFRALYIDGTGAEAILGQHAAVAASPLASLAVRTAAKIREAALIVAGAHSLGLPDFLAMTCVVSAHVLVMRNPGSGIERLILSVVGDAFLADSA